MALTCGNTTKPSLSSLLFQELEQNVNLNIDLENMSSQLNIFVIFINSGLSGAESIAPVYGRQKPIFSVADIKKKIELVNLILEISVYVAISVIHVVCVFSCALQQFHYLVHCWAMGYIRADQVYQNRLPLGVRSTKISSVPIADWIISATM